MTEGIDIPDGGDNNTSLSIGSGNDLGLYHDGSNSYIKDRGTGNLYIRGDDTLFIQSASGEDKLKATTNGSIELYYDNSKKFQTTSTGLDILGSDTTGSNLNGDLVINNAAGTRYAVFDASHTKLNFSDNASITIGNSNDLQIYHDSSNGNSHINESGSGSLVIKATNTYINSSSDEAMIAAIADGSVELYHNASKKFETFSDGLKFYGHQVGQTAGKFLQVAGDSSNAFAIGMTSGSDLPSGTGTDLHFHHWNGSSWDKVFYVNRDFVNIPDSKKIGFGDSNDLEIFHDGSNSYIKDAGTGSLLIRGSAVSIQSTSGEAMIEGVADGAVTIKHDNAKRFETGSDHVSLQGSGSDASGVSYIKFKTGNGSHRANIGKTSAINGRLSIMNLDNDSVEFGTGNSVKLELQNAGHLIPSSNNSYDLGGTSNRWANVYTNDLNLSNEGGSNDVDGTWGSYTIQEGEESLFLINKRNGKKYKFNLTEVS